MSGRLDFTTLAVFIEGRDPREGCFACKHIRRETESWEMPHIVWYECDKRPQNSNLRNFPFRRTSCTAKEPRL